MRRSVLATEADECRKARLAHQRVLHDPRSAGVTIESVLDVDELAVSDRMSIGRCAERRGHRRGRVKNPQIMEIGRYRGRGKEQSVAGVIAGRISRTVTNGFTGRVVVFGSQDGGMIWCGAAIHRADKIQ